MEDKRRKSQMKISDDIRRIAEEYDVLPLYELADRIDAEMVELPMDADGVPFHVGDTVWGCVVRDSGGRVMETSEERRDIAARLRESRDYISGLPKVSLEQKSFDTFERILRCIDYEHGNIFDYLADLIDPTCHKVIPSEIDGYVFCSNCMAEIGEYGVPNYCHNCGHRLVD